jgi:phosphotransferase system HPr-like phosphotransfer protein
MKNQITLTTNSNLFLQKLVVILHEFEGDLFVSKGPFTVDARSVLGLLSLGGLEQTTLHGDITEEIKSKVEELMRDF